MKNNRLYTILLFLFLLLAVLFYFFFPGDKFDWHETYKEDSKDPYATYVFHNLLKNYFPGEKFVELTDSLSESLPTDFDEQPASYFFVGQGFVMDDKSMDALVDFIKNGNTAFLSCRYIPDELIEKIYEDSIANLGWSDFGTTRDTLITVNFVDPGLEDSTGFGFNYYYKNQLSKRLWRYLPYEHIESDTLNMEEYGYFNEYTNMAGIRAGKGQLIIHTTPILFTNFELLEETDLEHISRVCSYLPEGTIYWDAISRVDEWTARRKGKSPYSYPTAGFSEDGPLKYILSQPPLAWAWYIGLALVMLFVVFRAKRKQRIIPVLEKNTNTSLEFIATIGDLLFQKNNHKALSLQQLKLFKTYIWQHYHISTKKMDENTMQSLHQKSNVSIDLIKKIFTLAENIKSARYVSENSMSDLYQLIEQFYKTCK